MMVDAMEPQVARPNIVPDVDPAELWRGILPDALAAVVTGAREKLEEMLAGKLTPKQMAALSALRQRIEAREVAPGRMDLNRIALITDPEGGTIYRENMGGQAIVLFPDEWKQLSGIRFLAANGADIFLEEEEMGTDDDVFILRPDEVGERPRQVPGAIVAVVLLPVDPTAFVDAVHTENFLCAAIEHRLKVPLPENADWDRIVRANKGYPAAAIGSGKAKKIDDEYLLRFALQIIRDNLRKKDWAFLARFAGNMKNNCQLAIPDEWIAAFKNFGGMKD